MTRAELIAENRYMVLSTADASGCPWASPVWFAPDGEEAFLWISRPDTRPSLHTREPPGERQGLFGEAGAEEAGPDPVLVAAYSAHSISQGLNELTVAEVSPPRGAFRLYRAAAAKMWMFG